MSGVPLERPEPPTIEHPLTWPTACVAVFGAAEGELADALAGAWTDAFRLDVRLRHAAGSSVSESHVEVHPDALVDTLRAIQPAGPTVGVGTAFAAAVKADLLVVSGSTNAILTLPPALRGLARTANLVLESPRLEVMRLLGQRLSAHGFPV